MKTYKVAVSWEVCGEVEVEAETLEQACKIAEEDNDIELPSEYNYIDASFRADYQMSEYLNKSEDEIRQNIIDNE